MTFQEPTPKGFSYVKYANALDDFLKLFGAEANVEERSFAIPRTLRFDKPEDSQFDNRAYHEAVAEHLGSLPEDQFQEAAKTLCPDAAARARRFTQ